ncbi:FAD-binding oxidoreductase [Acidovorax sp. SRB_24]|uniref:NAD(P)/FAD-dependent oxidoreductase n=1 Tax=Acidovorax sp. SRB_24 TaxID=1962700 RepID=UPI00145DDDCA|nr:FAD-dependent oxidoreductase [Acidovorax sp. SRB_24]NMM78873.1 amino acid dehydrogenase [Acidovorax sp. SRB_24]
MSGINNPGGERHAVVIGAGAVGCATAIEAIRVGMRVTVIEPGVPGSPHATSYGNSGWLSTHSVIPPALPGAWRKVPGWLADPLGPLAVRWRYLPKALPWLLSYLASGWTEARVQRTADALRGLLSDAPALHQRLAAEAGVSHLIEHRGILHVYRSRQEFEGEALAWRVRARTGVQWDEWDEATLRSREPDLDARYTFAILVGEAGHCRDPGAYVAALARHAQSLGARFVQSRATGFRIENGRLRAVLSEDGEIACDSAAICSGARSAELAAAVGSPVPLDSERGYHVQVKSPTCGPRTPMMVADGKLIAHWMDGGLRAGGQVEFAGLAAPANWKRADILYRHLQTMFEGLPLTPEEPLVHRWLGHRPSTPDGLPCIGPSAATPDVVLAFGHGHIGLGGSARTGQWAAQLLAGNSLSAFALAFSPARFQLGRQLKGSQKRMEETRKW